MGMVCSSPPISSLEGKETGVEVVVSQAVSPPRKVTFSGLGPQKFSPAYSEGSVITPDPSFKGTPLTALDEAPYIYPLPRPEAGTRIIMKAGEERRVMHRRVCCMGPPTKAVIKKSKATPKVRKMTITVEVKTSSTSTDTKTTKLHLWKKGEENSDDKCEEATRLCRVSA